MSNDIDLRKLTAAVANLERTMDRQNRVLQALTKEIQRGNQAAEARSRRDQTRPDARGGAEDRTAGPGGGQGEEGVRQGAPSSRSQEEVSAELEAKRPIYGE